MSAAQHTPTPWTAGHKGFQHCDPIDIWSSDKTLIATLSFTAAFEVVHREQAVANAEHIVRCVNTHADLVAVSRSIGLLKVEDVIQEIEHCHRGEATSAEMAVILMKFFNVPQARAALAKAEGRS